MRPQSSDVTVLETKLLADARLAVLVSGQFKSGKSGGTDSHSEETICFNEDEDVQLQH